MVEDRGIRWARRSACACTAEGALPRRPLAFFFVFFFAHSFSFAFSFAVSFSLALGGSLGFSAAAHATTGPAAGDRELDLAALAAMIQAAQTRFETADYAGAIELWTEAYAALPPSATYAEQRGVLLYQIAQASVEAYALDPQVLYLRKAERLFATYLASLDPENPEELETRRGLEETLADLRQRIAAAEGDRDSEPGPAPTTPEPKPTEPAPEEPPVANTTDTPPATSPRPGRNLQIAGGVVLGLGVGTLGVMTGGLAWGARVDSRGDAARARGETDPAIYRELLDDGLTANRLALGAAIAGVTLTAIGTTLLTAGILKFKRARDSERDNDISKKGPEKTSRRGPDREVALTPALAPTTRGLVLRYRF